MWLKTFKYACDDKSFYFVWNFLQMWKIKYERIVDFFLEEKIIKFAKI
jgi:hypothetical protein